VLSQPTLFDHPIAAEPAAASPGRISVTDLVSFRRCPRQYYWLAIRPLPRRGSAAARLGTAAHRWIELRASNQLGLLGLLEPVESADDFDPEGAVVHGQDPPTGDRGVARGVNRPETALEGFQAAFLASPYASLQPRRVEAPFVLAVAQKVVRGRVDAVYLRDDHVEVVDFKTGRPPEDGDSGATVQLDVYAVAAVDVWSEDPATLRTTYCYLEADGDFHTTATEWTPDRVTAAREQLATTLGRLAEGAWPATPGGWCRRCEWQEVCPAGQSFLAGASAPPAPGAN
jgi:DNA helicase-2/ATP-dependent DNA helicase PcrA